jgi:hypothetical protein
MGETVMWLRRFATVLLAAMLSCGVGERAAYAQPSSAFTVPPGGRVLVSFEAYCLDFGGTFPRALAAPNTNAGLAPANVRAALNYIRGHRPADSQAALQAQYAIWRLRGVAGLPRGSDAVAQGTPVTDPANARSILDGGLNRGEWSLDVTAWGPIGRPVQIASGAPEYFYGAGQMLVRNNTRQQLALYMPVGTIFPPTGSGHQRMTGYPTGVQVVRLPQTGGGEVALAAAVCTAWLAVGVQFWRTRRRVAVPQSAV